MRKYKTHYTEHYNETACGRLLYTHHGKSLIATTNPKHVTCKVCRRVLDKPAEAGEERKWTAQ